MKTSLSWQDAKTRGKAAWRQGRRAFDARQLSERRLLIVAVLAATVFVADALWLTPTFTKFKAAQKRLATAVQARDALTGEAARQLGDLQRRQDAAQIEIKRLGEVLAQDEQTLQQQQAILAPAREMRLLLEGLLEENARLRVMGIRTLAPQEVALRGASGNGRQPMLYRQSLEIALAGSYGELLRWLHSVETLPKRVLWDSIRLSSDDNAELTLAVTVHTFSPDRDALEIAP